MSDPYIAVPLSGMRKAIAARMTEAATSIPQFRLTADVEMDALMKLRTELARDVADRLSLNDLLVKACASALMEVPTVNIQWADNEIHQYRSADISIVVAVEGGLATPIVRQANKKSIWQIAQAIRALTARAVSRQLTMAEVVGGSFSISNLGMFGVDQFDAIVNPPQCAVLALGRAKPCMAVSTDYTPRVSTILRATLSADHRAIDGLSGAKFLAAFREYVENPRELTIEGGTNGAS